MRGRGRLCLLVLAFGCAGTEEGAPSDGGGTGGGDGGQDAAPPGPDASPGLEVCDGVDNDADQFVDEGSDEALCGTVANGLPRCNGIGGCQIETCETGFADVDNLFNTG